MYIATDNLCVASANFIFRSFQIPPKCKAQFPTFVCHCHHFSWCLSFSVSLDPATSFQVLPNLRDGLMCRFYVFCFVLILAYHCGNYINR